MSYKLRWRNFSDPVSKSDMALVHMKIILKKKKLIPLKQVCEKHMLLVKYVILTCSGTHVTLRELGLNSNPVRRKFISFRM